MSTSSCSDDSDIHATVHSRPSSPTTLFEDSLFSLFAHNQPARGNPGEERTFSHVNLPRRYASRRTTPHDAERRQSTRRPTAIRYRLCQNDGVNNRLFAHHQWDAGLYMAQMICEQSHASSSSSRTFLDVRRRTVVELGAGSGLTSLVSSLMGAHLTVMTDYPDPSILSNLHDNVFFSLSTSKHPDRPRSTAFDAAQSCIRVNGLTWGDTAEEDTVLSHLPPAPTAAFDLVLAADTLWVSSSHPHLIHSIARLLRKSSDARCVLIAGFHTGRPAVSRFFRLLAKSDILPDWQQRWGGVWERSVDADERPWSGASIPTRADRERSRERQGEAQAQAQGEDEDEEMGDVSGRATWVVVASLRWADL